MHITDILIREGFVAKRSVYKKKEHILVDNFMDSFSTMVDGGLGIIYVKDDIKVAYGLHEYKKPPTLIYPRPRIELKKYWGKEIGISTHCDDDVMNHCLSKESHEDIYKAMFDKSIVFKYDLTK